MATEVSVHGVTKTNNIYCFVGELLVMHFQLSVLQQQVIRRHKCYLPVPNPNNKSSFTNPYEHFMSKYGIIHDEEKLSSPIVISCSNYRLNIIATASVSA